MIHLFQKNKGALATVAPVAPVAEQSYIFVPPEHIDVHNREQVLDVKARDAPHQARHQELQRHAQRSAMLYQIKEHSLKTKDNVYRYRSCFGLQSRQ